MFTKIVVVLLIGATMALAGCQTGTPGNTGAVLPEPAQNSIVIGDHGYFSLDKDTHSFLVFSMNLDHPEKIKIWTVEWKNNFGTTVYRMMGAPPLFPKILTWDGRTQDGSWAEPGIYTANLTVDYTEGRVQTEYTSTPFTIELSKGSDVESFTLPVSDEQTPNDLE